MLVKCKVQMITNQKKPDTLYVFFLKFLYYFFYQACAVLHPLPRNFSFIFYLLFLIPPRLALFLRRQLPSISCILFDVLLSANGLLGTHGRNIAPCGTICRVSMGATVFWVCRTWNNRQWWGWFVRLLYLILEDFEELSRYLEVLL